MTLSRSDRDKIITAFKLREAGKDCYAKADEIDQKVLHKIPIGTMITYNNETFILTNNFAEKNVSYKVAGVRMLEFKKATKAQIAENKNKE